ncbi:MAG: lytic murein transglycosylase [Parvularculaceae bacterium]|nr:lytic murein transglycosylase [Parvularculaceae bacterium]
MRVRAVILAGLMAVATPAAAQDPSFEDWIKSFRSEASAAGIRKEVLDSALSDIRINPRVFELNDNQPEFARNVWDYLDSALSENRVGAGRAKLAEHRALLAEIEADYGVAAETIAAIWGQESSYGAVMGDYDVIEALATLGWKGRRTAYGRAQLIGALKILQNNYADRKQLRGSWAGAMGHTQFIPTTYLTFAVDRDRDGRRDLWTNLGDVFASTANYLAHSGYRSGQPWGVEVMLPQGFDYALADVDIKRALAEWRSAGIAAARGDLGEMDPNMRGRVFLPAGARGPAFIVFQNFDAILKYNNSTAYGLAIAMLGDRIDGRNEGLVAGWPREDRALTLSERKALQQALKDRGFDPGPIDGVLGAGSKKALRAWQRSQGLPADAYASASTLEKLTGGSATGATGDGSATN